MLRLLVSLGALVALTASQAYAETHRVKKGESLWRIARKYGCEVDAVKRANRMKKSSTVYSGATLKIPRCGKGRRARLAARTRLKLRKGRRKRVHTIKAGDTLFGIASKYDVTVQELKRKNGLRDNTIVAGRQLVVSSRSKAPVYRERIIPKTGVAVHGQSVGLPQAGRLQDPAFLPPSPHYYRRRPEYMYGTDTTVQYVEEAAAVVREHFPNIHRLAVGDLSQRRGGPIPRHNSHQAGRDVDLGFYFHNRPRGYPKSFVRADDANLHWEATWLLIETLAATRDEDGGVVRMYVSYPTQKLLYEKAQEAGVEQDWLDELFQYPKGKWTREGLIRHEPKHNDHIHVRFGCQDGDTACM